MMAGAFSMPTLKSLRAVEAVLRRKSLTLAARELNVSVSAVSFQISNAEAALGRALAHREGRGLRVSKEAEALAEDLRSAFQAIEAAVRRFATPGEGTNVVTVSLLTSFAALWLLPRLPRFWTAHPDVDVRITTSERRVDLAGEGIDCAIRAGEGSWDGLAAEALFPQLLSPLCHPSYAERFGRPHTAKSLGEHLLIRDVLRDHEWLEWFARAGEAPNCSAVHEVEGKDLVVSAVEAGLGVGLIDVSLVQDRIAEGKLIRMFPTVLETGWKHWLVRPSGRPETTACQSFTSWLRVEAERSRHCDASDNSDCSDNTLQP